jgi:AraC family transcriptional regulator, regulatory protein of adaptative response / methylated-DNA-[protein]-cysteine methyltransferase
VKSKEIQFTVENINLNTNMGWVIVAASKTGICAIALGDTSEELVNSIHTQFPQAKFCDNDPTLEQWISDAIAAIDIPQSLNLPLDIPLDIQGTAFQKQVWQVLRTIPIGTTLSYQQVATQIGNPKAVRAVASACAANKLAISIPCHRVIRSNGALSGYRWGIERKRALLEKEASQSSIIRI